MDRRRTIARLHARLARRFDLITEPIAVGPLRIAFTRVADPEKVLDELCHRIDIEERLTGRRVTGDHLGLPYWAELWDSAIGIGQYLAMNTTDRRRADIDANPSPADTVLDLGCGMGLAGTVAAVMGADVTFADVETDCLLFSAVNGLRHSANVSWKKTDWQRDDLGRRFDLIIGSDVLYDRTQWPHLDAFFRRHLQPNGRVLLGEPGRQSGDLFIPWILERNWQFHQYDQSVPTRATPIRLFELKL